MDNIVYKVNDLVKVYPIGDTGITALRGVTFEIYEGEFLVIMGPSGSGKTTLLNLLSGIDFPSSGYVMFRGMRLSSLRESELERLRLEKIGIVFQFLNLIRRMTARENIELPMISLGIPGEERLRRVDELSSKLGIRDKIDKLVEELSGGEQQRVAIAAALANDPEVILADEPTAELDSENISRVINLFKEEVGRGKTVVVNTHDPRVAREADRVVMLEDGLVKGIYRPTELSTYAEGGGDISMFIRRRLEEVRREIDNLVSEFRNGKVGIDDFIRRYTRLKTLEEVYRDEFRVRG